MGPFKLTRRRRKRLVRFFRPASRRDALIASLAHWNRNQAVRITAAVLLAWLIGAGGIYLAERGVNPAFDTFGESLWSVWVLLFSGMEIQPVTWLGRLFAMILIGAGVGLVGLFTGTVASI